nr:reverse transcriptase domain-containing protein [Tanacetum cinerariifolium]
MPCHKCTNCNHLGHFAKDCRVRPRMVTPLNTRNPTIARRAYFECGGTEHYKATCPRLNRAPREGRNCQNQAMAIKGGQGHGNNCNQAREGAFMMGAKESRQDQNIMTGTFTLNNHYTTTLFDFGATYSFVSTTFIPLLDIDPSGLGFSYEIEIVSGQLVEINKVIRECKLEIEGHTFNIDLIPFGHVSFDVIVRMDWLSRHKAEIVFHKKVVRIPLPHSEMLRVIEEKPKEKVRHLMSVKFKEQKLKDIVVVRNFLETNEEHEIHLGLILKLLKKEKLYENSLSMNSGCKKYSSLGMGLMRGKVIAYASRQLKIYEKNYTTHDLELVANALSRKERIKPNRVQAINMIIQSSINDRILAAQNEASEVVNTPAKMLQRLDK